MADALLSETLKPSALLEASRRLPDVELAIVMESLEGATRKEQGLIDDKLFGLLAECRAHAAQRVKWEAACTISNVSKQHSDHLGPAVDALLVKTNSDGTVVRWATAQARSAILRAGYTDNGLRLRLRETAAREQDESVLGVYERTLRLGH